MKTEDRAYQLARSFRKINRCIWKTDDVILDETGLTHAEIDVLFIVYHHKQHNENSITASEIAKIMEVTIPAVMHRLTDLEKEGYIERISSEVDKRRKFINITSKWLDLIKKLDKQQEEIIMKFLLTLPRKGEVLCNVLNDFGEYLEGVTDKND